MSSRTGKVLFSVPEAAEKLGYSRQYIYDLIRTKKLKAVQVTSGGHWKIRARDLEEFIDRATEVPGGAA